MRWGWILPALSFILLLSCRQEPSSASRENFTIPLYTGSNKLWAHRVNNPDTALARLKSFPGIEIDIVFEREKGKFNVRHDIEEASSPYYLKDFLSRTESINEESYYWLDFKNLNSENVTEAGEKLEEILDELDLRRRVIVESYMYKELIAINLRNIYTSYWVPHLDQNSSKEDSLKAFNIITDVIESQRVNALSANWTMSSFLSSNFKDQNIHIWTTGLITEEHKKVIEYYDGLHNVKVILVDYKENFLN